MNRTEIAWLAGIVEGEGYIGLHTKKAGQNRKYPVLSVAMTDLDVILRLHEVTGVGHVSGLIKRRDREQPLRRWMVSDWPSLYPLLRRIRPFMGQRRGARIDEVFEYERTHPRVGQGNGRRRI